MSGLYCWRCGLRWKNRRVGEAKGIFRRGMVLEWVEVPEGCMLVEGV